MAHAELGEPSTRPAAALGCLNTVPFHTRQVDNSSGPEVINLGRDVEMKDKKVKQIRFIELGDGPLYKGQTKQK